MEKDTSISIRPVAHRLDERGIGISLSNQARAFLGNVAELHYVTINPGAVRGNHAHAKRREVILAIFKDEITFAWRMPFVRSPESRILRGVGAVEIEIQESIFHAIKNTGNSVINVISCSNAQPVEGDTRYESLLESD